MSSSAIAVKIAMCPIDSQEIHPKKVLQGSGWNRICGQTLVAPAVYTGDGALLRAVESLSFPLAFFLDPYCFVQDCYSIFSKLSLIVTLEHSLQ